MIEADAPLPLIGHGSTRRPLPVAVYLVDAAPDLGRDPDVGSVIIGAAVAGEMGIEVVVLKHPRC